MRTRNGTRGFAAKRSIAAGMAFVLALATRGNSLFAAGPSVQVNSVAHGNVTVQQSGAATVIHASNNSIINYKQFDIPAGASVQFIQPSASSRVLNRISSASPSQINGTLTANGVVYLINPAGVIFGNGAVVNTAGIFAASAHLSDADFLSGTNHFTNSQGAVTNAGLIEAGEVVLVGQSIANSGTIVAPNGLVAFAAGSDVYVVENNNSLALKVTGAATPAAPGKAAVENTGTIEAPGGDVNLVAGDIYGLAVKNAGEVHARNIALQSKGTTLADGKLDASSTAAGTTGGTVQVLGDLAAVTGKIDASGAAGGGTVFIGGANQGLGNTQTATYSYIGRGADIRADALTSGNGGNVVVWSNQATYFYGNISAKGGAFGGNGGNAEVSGHYLAFKGTVDLSAPGGLDGTLLLDPATITISATSPGADDATLDAGSAGTPGFIASGDLGGSNLTISAADVVTNLGSHNVILGATTTITVNGAISANTPNYLLLSVGGAGSIILNAPITITGGGALVGRATAVTTNVNANVTVNTGGSIQNGADLVKNGGVLTVAAGTYSGDVTLGQDFDPAAVSPGLTPKAFTIETTGAVTVSGALTETNGSGLTFGAASPFILATTSTMSFADPVTLGQNSSLTPGGGVTFSSAITGAGKDLAISGGGSFAAITNAGAFTVSGTTNLNGNVSAASINVNTVIGGATVGNAVTTITTTGAQTYGGNVTLNSAGGTEVGVTFASTTSGKIEFKGDVNPSIAPGGGTLNDIVVTVAAGSIVLDGSAGNGGGNSFAFHNVTLQAPSLTLTGTLNFNGALAGSDTTVTLAATTAEIDRAATLVASGGKIILAAAGTYTPTAGSPLTFTKPMSLDTTVGSVTINASLVDTAGVTLSTAGIASPIVTTGTQTWSTVTINTGTALTGTSVSLGTLVAGANDFTITGDASFTNITSAGNLVVTGNAAFNGPVAGVTSINVNTIGGATTIGTTAGTIATTGDQTYNGPITLNSTGGITVGTTLSSTGGQIEPKGDINPSIAPGGGTLNDLAVTSNTGSIVLDGALGNAGGNSFALHNISLQAPHLTLTKSLNFNGALAGANTLVTVAATTAELDRAATLVASGGTIVVAMAGSYTPAAPSPLAFTKPMTLNVSAGAVTINASLTDTSAVTLITGGLGAPLVTTGSQTWSAMTLNSPTALTGTTVNIGGTLNGQSNSLTINGVGIFSAVNNVVDLIVTGDVTFNANVSAATINVNTLSGGTTIGTGAFAINTTGNQTYGGNTILNSQTGVALVTNFQTTGGTIEFKGDINPSQAPGGGTSNDLVVTANTLAIILDGALGNAGGNSFALHNIVLQAPTLTLTKTLNFTGSLTGPDNTVILAATTAEIDRAASLVANAGTIVIAVAGTYTPTAPSPLAFTQAMTLNVSVGSVTINASLTDNSPLTLVTGGLGAPLVTTGSQTWAAVALTNATALTGSAANFGGALTGGGNNLTINGNASFAAVSGVGALVVTQGAAFNSTVSATTVNITGASTLNAGATSITTTGGQTYTGPVTTAAASTAFNSSGAGTISFISTLNPAAANLDLAVSIPSGALIFGGSVGVPTPYRNVTINSGNLQLNTLAFTGTFTGASTTVTVQQGGSVQSAADFVAPGGTISLTPGAGTYAGGLSITKVVTLDTQNGNVIISGPINDNSSLTLGKSGATAVSLTSGGAQSYANTVTLNAPTTLTSALGVTGLPGSMFISAGFGGSNKPLTINGLATFDTVEGITTLTVNGNANITSVGPVTSVIVTGDGIFGDVGVTGSLTVNGNCTITSALDSLDTVSIGGNGTFAAINLAGGVGGFHIGGNGIFNGVVNGAFSLSITGNATFATTVSTFGPLTVGGNANFNGPLTANSSVAITGNGAFAAVTSSGPLTVGQVATFNGNVTAPSLAINGATTVNSGATTIASTGNQTYVGNVALTGAGTNTFSVSSGVLNFHGALLGNGGTVVLSNPTGILVLGTQVSGFGSIQIAVPDLALSQPLTGSLTGVGINTVEVSGAGLVQNAVTLVAPNGVVTVAPGTYNESVVITQPLTLDATNGTIILTGSFSDNSPIRLGKSGATSFGLAASTETFGGAVNFATPIAMLTGNVVFANKQQVNGLATGLTITGNVSFDSTVNLTDLTVTGSATFLDPTINTSGSIGQLYNGPAVLQSDTTLNSSGTGGVHFKSTINGAFALTINTTGTAANPFVPVGNVLLDGTANVGALAITSSGSIDVHAVTASAGNIVLMPNPVLLGASLSGLNIVSGSLFLYAPGQIAIEGDIKATAGNVTLGGGRTGTQFPATATIFSDVPNVTISGGTVAMGPLERFVAAVPGTTKGSITINASTKAVIGDMTALDSLAVLAPNVTFNLRLPAPVQNNQQLLSAQLVSGGVKVFPSADGAVGIVATNSIAFSPGAAFSYPGGGRSDVSFATAEGTDAAGGTVPGVVLGFNLKLTGTSIPLGDSRAVAVPGLIAGIPSGPFSVTYLTLLGTGPSIVNPSNAIASVLPSQAPSPAAAAELSGSDSAALHDIGIDVRSMDAAEREAQLRKIGVFDDVPGEPVGSLVPTAGLANLKVAIGRLPVAATHDLVETFHTLFYDPVLDKSGQPVLDTDGQPKWTASAAKHHAMATKLEAGWKAFQAYRDTKKDVPATGTEFRKYLEEHVANKTLKDNGEADALAQLKALQGLYARVDAINLAPSELRKARIAIFRTVADPTVESSEGDPLQNQAVLESAVGVQPISVAAAK